MKISFWSNGKGPSCVSANLAAVSIICAIAYPYTITIMENHISSNNLGQAFFSDKILKLVKERGFYYEGCGIEGLLRKIYRGEFVKKDIDYYRKDIIRNHLYYLPQGKIIHNNTFSHELYINSLSFFYILEESTDILFIDTAKNNISTNNILEESDLIVVNLLHNRDIHEDFFRYNSYLKKKAVFLVGKSPYKKTLFSRKISKKNKISAEQIVEIPYNAEFKEALHSGRLVEFILSNYQCSRKGYNYLFIQSLKRAAEMIISRTLQLRKTGIL